MEKLNAIRLLRRSGIAEGISFLVLLGIAMPLKYLADMPIAVKVVGWIHGVLFMVFIYAVIKVYRTLKWDPERIGRALIASVLPFGTFVADRAWRRDEAALRATLNV
jgi:integral membrane protein